jgi:hypothetical protein
MTSPKAIARSFARYAARHLSDGYHVLHFSQTPGTFKRSSIARNGTEQLVHSPKWLFPIAYLSYHSSAALWGVYALVGRFNPQHELEVRPSELAARLGEELKAARLTKDDAQVERLEEMRKRERAEVLGERSEWAKYRSEFKSIVQEAIRESVILNRESLKLVFKDLEDSGTPILEGTGGFWLGFSESGQGRRVGLNAGNIFAPGSDASLAYRLLLGRVERILKSPARGRESMMEFKEDWALLQQARSRTVASIAFSKGRPAQ